MRPMHWQSLAAVLFIAPNLVLAAAGDPLTPEIRVNAAAVRGYSFDTPDVARSANGTSIVVWSAIGDSESPPRPLSVRARLFAANGSPIGSEITVSEDRVSTYSKPVVAMNASGGFAIAWRAGYDGDPHIALRTYAPDGTPRGVPTRANTAVSGYISDRADIAMDACGRVTVAFQTGIYQDVRIRQFDPAGVALSDRESVISDGNADRLYAPALAMEPDGDFVLAWQSETNNISIPLPLLIGYPLFIEPLRQDVRFRRFAANGTPLAASTVVDQAFVVDRFLGNGLLGGFVGEPGIAVDTDGDTVVAWPSAAAGFVSSIRARRYNAQGRPVGQTVVAGPASSLSAGHVAVSSDPVGNFALSWNNDEQILARRFRADGRAAAPAFVVNPTFTTTNTDLSRTAIAHDAAGNIAIAWHGERSDVLLRLYEGP